MKKFVSIIACIFLLAGCEQIEKQKVESEAKEALAFVLEDSATAVFRDVTKSASGLCGWVNATNALGARTGFVPFVTGNGDAYLLNDQVPVAEWPNVQMLAIRCEFASLKVENRWNSDFHEVDMKYLTAYMRSKGY